MSLAITFDGGTSRIQSVTKEGLNGPLLLANYQSKLGRSEASLHNEKQTGELRPFRTLKIFEDPPQATMVGRVDRE